MDKATFDEQVVAQLGVLHSVSYSLLQNPEDQADAVQEAVKKALTRYQSLRDERYFRTWMVRILINECHNIHRQKRRLVPTEEVEIVVPPQADGALFESMGRLEEKFRLPLVLHHIAGYATKEVAHILRVPEGTVKYRLVRGRRLLETMLDEKEA